MVEITPLDMDSKTERMEMLQDQDFLSVDQWLNLVAGINTSVDGLVQAVTEGGELMGILPAGSAEVFTQEAKKARAIADKDRAAGKNLPGAGGVELVGEILPALAVPNAAFAGGVRGAVTGGLFGATRFQEDVNESRSTDIALGAGIGGAVGKLFGGPAKNAAQKAISQTEQKLLPAPQKQIGQQLRLPAPVGQRPTIVSPNTQRALPAPKQGRVTPMAPSGPAIAGGTPAYARGARVINEVNRPQQKLLTGQTQKLLTHQAEGIPLPSPQRFAAEGSPALRQKFGELSTSASAMPLGMTKKMVTESMKAVKKLSAHTKNLTKKISQTKSVLKNTKAPATVIDKAEELLIGLKEQKLATAVMSREITSKAKVASKALQKPVAERSAKAGKVAGKIKLKDMTGEQMTAELGFTAETQFNTDQLRTMLARRRVDAMAEAKRSPRGLGAREGGAMSPQMAGVLAGAGVGAVGGGIASDGSPAGIAVGALAGAAGGSALGKAGRIKTRAKPDSPEVAKAKSKSKADVGKAVSEVQKQESIAKKLGESIKNGTPKPVAEAMAALKKASRDYIGSLGTRLEMLSPQLATALERQVYDSHRITGRWMEGMQKFKKLNHKTTMSDKDQVLFKQALLGSSKAGVKFLRTKGEHAMADEIENVIIPMMDEFKVYLQEAGYSTLHMRKDFFPRQVIDTSYFDSIKTAQSYLERVAQKKKVDLGDFDNEDALTKLMNGMLHKSEEKVFGTASGNLKLRKVGRINATNVDAYADPTHSLANYIQSVVEQVERQRFLKAHGAKKVVGPNGENLDTAVEGLKSMLKGAPKLDGTTASIKEVNEAAELVKSIFGQGQKSPHKLVQGFRNYTYTALLTNPISAMTQLGDLALGAHKNTIGDTAAALIAELAGKGSKLNGIDKTTLLGVRNVTTDFAGGMRSRDVLDAGLTWSGFKYVDTLGKNVYINAAMRNNRRLSKEQFTARWQKTLDPKGGTKNTDRTFEKVQNFKKINDDNAEDIGWMLWNGLTSAQPISPLSMPKGYHDNPNGRMMYMLQSFTLKALDIGRKDVLWKAANGDYTGAGKSFASLAGYFVLMNGTVDAAKDFVRGKEQLPIVDRVVDNMMRLAGVNPFLVGQVSRAGLGGALKGAVLPTALIDDPLRVFKAGGVADRLFE